MAKVAVFSGPTASLSTGDPAAGFITLEQSGVDVENKIIEMGKEMSKSGNAEGMLCWLL